MHANRRIELLLAIGSLCFCGCVVGVTGGTSGTGGPGPGETPGETPEETPVSDAIPEGLELGYGDDEEAIDEGDGWGMGGGGEPLEEAPAGEDDEGEPEELGGFGGGGEPLGGADPGPGDGMQIADPCRHPPRHGYAVRRGTNGPDRIRGTRGPDLIFGLGGADVIWGLGGNDIICGGAGADRIYGGHGRDYIDGGLGRDTIYGGFDADVIHGRNGGDLIHGGPGNDWISGDLLDDHLYGDAGDDVLIGAHGTDFLHGGEDSDWLRGDTGHDTFVGGAGVDTVSFMTATPPGQPRNDDGATVTQDGMLVDLSQRFCGTPEGDLKTLGWDGCVEERRWDGLASGDGFREALRGVERIVGSAFSDTLIGGADTRALIGGDGDDTLTGSGDLNGGPGADTCNGAPCDAGEASRGGDAYVALDERADDRGLVVIGAAGNVDDSLRIEMQSASVVRVTTDPGRVLALGFGCEHPASGAENIAVCDLAGPLRYVVAYGGDGSDHIAMGNGFPRDMTAHLDGGTGDDILDGGDGEDVLFAGRSGFDGLFGHAGDDALISESTGADRGQRGETYGGGADILDAGNGNDQLVSDFPCGGHTFRGGRGVDIAGFARSPDLPIYAQLGGDADDPKEFRGYSYNPDRCGFVAYGTHLEPGLEILEGADGADRLFGNHGPNVIWAWGGADTVGGDGGDDTLEGHLGADDLDGNAGADVLRGGGDWDTLHANDDRADRQLSCGAEPGGAAGGRLYRDTNDPEGSGCGQN